YADEDYSGAARLWWALRYYGHEAVSILDGGMHAWLTAGYGVDTGVPVGADAATGVIRFTPRIQTRWRADREEILGLLSTREAAIVDTRPREQYDGRAVWTPPGSLYISQGLETANVDGLTIRGGHIPGAVNLVSSDNLDASDLWRY